MDNFADQPGQEDARRVRKKSVTGQRDASGDVSHEVLETVAGE